MKNYYDYKLKSLKKPYIAINGYGFFPVCYENNINNDGKCNNIQLTRNGSFRKVKNHFVNDEGATLLGVKFSEGKTLSIQNKKSKKEKINEYCLEEDKYWWENDVYKVEYPTCNLKELDSQNQINTENKLADLEIKQSELEVISFSTKSYVEPTSYIKLKGNLDPSAGKKVGLSEYENNYDFDQSNYIEAFTQDKEVKLGNIVNINYVGRLANGTKFLGGSADYVDLVIGSKKFIRGFEKGLVGQKKGSQIELPLVFPKNYHVKELAGQPVIFDVTVNDIKKPENIKVLSNIHSEHYIPHFTQNIKIFDSNGNERFIDIHYLKTQHNAWAVEVVINSDSRQDLRIDNPLEEILDNGIIEFDDFGNLKNKSGFRDNISLKWQDDSYNLIKIDYSLTQFGGHISYGKKLKTSSKNGKKRYNSYEINDPESVEVNGCKKITIKDYKFDVHGNLFFLDQNNNKNILYNVPTNIKKINDDLLISKSDVTKGIVLFKYQEISEKSKIFANTEFKMLYRSFDEDINTKIIPQQNVYTVKNEDFLPLRCNLFGNINFLTKNFVNYNGNFKNEDDCCMLGINLLKNNSYDDGAIDSKNLECFEVPDYFQYKRISTKINMGNILISKSIKETTNYDPQNKELNLSNGHYKSQINPIIVELVDQQGSGHPVFISFIKKSANKINFEETWHVEIYEQKNTNFKNNILITDGSIKFNRKGELIYVADKLKKIEFYGNQVNIDWDEQNTITGNIIYKSCKISEATTSKILVRPSTDGVSTVFLDNFVYNNGQIIAKYKNNLFLKLFEFVVANPENGEELIQYYGYPGYLETENTIFNLAGDIDSKILKDYMTIDAD